MWVLTLTLRALAPQLVEEVLPEESSLSGVDTGAGVAAGGVGVAGLPEAAAEGGYVVPGVTSTDFVNRGTPLDGHLSVSVISASGLAEEVKAVVEIRIGMHSRKSPHSKHKSSTPEWCVCPIAYLLSGVDVELSRFFVTQG
jgi:hypothetical protein